MSEKTVKAGSAEVVLEVPLFAELAGYGPFFGRRNLGCRDALYCRVFSLSDGARRNLLIVSDVLSTDAAECRFMRKQLAATFNLCEEGILFMGTHTHSAPLIGSSSIGYGEVCPEFVAGWRKSVFAAVKTALADEETLHAFAGRAKLRKKLGQNRADPQNGHCDPEIRWVKLQRKDGSVKALLHNHAMHGVVFGRQQRLASADWMGDANRKIKERKLAEIPFFLYGCAGDINVIWTHPKPEERELNLEWISQSYVDDLQLSLAEGGQELNLAPLAAAMQSCELPTEPVSAAQLRGDAARLLAKLPSPHAALLQYMHDRMLEMAVLKDQGHKFACRQDLQYLGMGDLALFAIPGEPFIALGEKIMQEAKSRFPLALSCANGAAGYFPSPEMFARYPEQLCCDDYGAFGFYEVWFGPSKHRAKLKANIVEFITQSLLALESKNDAALNKSGEGNPKPI
ncbi:MAG: hypothetical protein PHG44_05685 [Lentisphaeria bacterium]|nr:hypothetical protein [Lentisphaeria bacterium]